MGYELMQFDSNEDDEPWEHSVHVSNSNMLEVRSSSKLAIVNAQESSSDQTYTSDKKNDYSSLRQSRSVSFVMNPLDCLDLENDWDDEEEDETRPRNEDAPDDDMGVEVVLQTINESCVTND